MNLRRIKSSRKEPAAGDAFVLNMCDRFYLFGLVVRSHFEHVRINNCVLVYIYKQKISSIRPPRAEDLDRNKLAMPPFVTGNQPWTGGYFVNVASVRVNPTNSFKKHCFEQSSLFEDRPVRYYDDHGKSGQRFLPCILEGLWQLGTIDDKLSAVFKIKP